MAANSNFQIDQSECCAALRSGKSRPTISRRAIPPKYFENIFKTNDSVGVTRQQTWLRNEEIAEYFGENLDILTDLNMDFQ